MPKPLWHYPPLVLLHFFVAAMGGVIVGLIPEVLIERLYRGTPIEAFAPGMALTALTIGYFLAHRLVSSERVAQWTWVIGVVWFLYGVHDLTRLWRPTWLPHEKSAWSYAKGQLFGPVSLCSATECLYRLFVTVPLVLSVTYSFGAFIRSRQDARESAELNSGLH